MFLWLSLVNLFLWVSLLNVQLLLNLSLKTTILCPVRTSINLNQSFSESISTGITTRIWRDSVVLREDIPHALKNLLIQPICVSADLLFNEMWFMFREGSDVRPWGTGVRPELHVDVLFWGRPEVIGESRRRDKLKWAVESWFKMRDSSVLSDFHPSLISSQERVMSLTWELPRQELWKD